MKAIQITQFGGPEAMEFKDVPTPVASGNQVRVRIKAAGVNFIDVYQRRGFYSVPLPFILGQEGAGVVEAVGPQVTEFEVGDRVAFTNVPGAYAEFVLVPEEKLVLLPERVDDLSAAAAMLQGMTAHYLTQSTYPLKPGDSCLVHAAAGGVGLLLIQMAKNCGARVLGTVSTEAKAQAAKEAGADEVILYGKTDFVQEVKRLTDGLGVNVVYDSVGLSTFEKSLDCLKPLGYLVSFGQSSGPVPPFDPLLLSRKGSLFLTRPTLAHYIADRPSLLQRATEVLGWVATRQIKLHIGQSFYLKEAADAHRSLESRLTTGKVLLLP